MDYKERNNEKYEQEILKAHEKLYPRKKRIAHNSPSSHFDNVLPNELFDQQNLIDINKFLGVQDLDFEKLQPRSKSHCIQKGKRKSSFPLLQKSQKHMKYINHNVCSASKQRAHVSINLNENNAIRKLNKDENQSDYESENIEGFYTQGIAESVKNRGRFKHVSETNSVDFNKDTNLKNKIKLNWIESEIKSNGKKENGHRSKSDDEDKYNFKDGSSAYKEKSSKHKNDSNKHKNRDLDNYKILESSNHKGIPNHKHKHKDKSRKHKHKSSEKYGNEIGKNCNNKISKHKVQKHKNESLSKQKSKHRHIRNQAEKEKCNELEEDLCLKEKIKLMPCSVYIEQCPDISFMIRDVTLSTNTLNKEQLDEMQSVENTSEAVLSENEEENNVPLETNDMDDSSDDDIMVIEERQFNVKISHTFSIKQECEPEKVCELENNVTQTEPAKVCDLESTITQTEPENLCDLENTVTQTELEKNSALQLEVIDLSDDNMSECEIEIIDVKGNENNKNILKRVVENSSDSVSDTVPSASKQLLSVVNPSNLLNVLSENEVSSCTSKSIDHSISYQNNDFGAASLKVPFKDQIRKSGLTDFELKLGNSVKCEESEDEMDDSISKILDLESVSEPSISPLIQLFEKESRDLKNIQNAARNYSNVAEGLKMLECEKLKRLKFMKCALKKFHTKQVLGSKNNLNPKNELDLKNIKLNKSSISTAVNEHLKNDKQQELSKLKINDSCNSSIPTVENNSFTAVEKYSSNLVQNATSSLNSEDDELEILQVYNSNSTVAVNNVNVRNPIITQHSLMKNKTIPEGNKSFSQNPQMDVFQSTHSFTSNTTACKPVISSVKSFNTQEMNTFGRSPISRREILQPISSSTISVDKIIHSNVNSYPHTSQDHKKVSSAFGQFCQVCGARAVFACQGCSKVYFCSNECGVGYWNKGHFAECC